MGRRAARPGRGRRSVPVERPNGQSAGGLLQVVRQDEPLAHDGRRGQWTAERIAERGDDLLRPARAERRVEPRSRTDHDRRPSPSASTASATSSGRRSYSTDPAALLALPRQRRRTDHGVRRARNIRAGDALGRLQRDPVVGCRDRTGQGRRTQPHVVEVDQAPAGRQVRLETPRGPASGASARSGRCRRARLRRPCRSATARRRPAAAWAGHRVLGSPATRTPRPPRSQASATVALRQRRSLRTAPEDEPPALPWLGGHRPRRCGIGVHVC